MTDCCAEYDFRQDENDAKMMACVAIVSVVARLMWILRSILIAMYLILYKDTQIACDKQLKID